MGSKKVLAFIVKLLVTAGLFVLLFKPQVFGLSPDFFGGVSPRDMLGELQDAGARNIAVWLAFAAVVKLCGMFAGILRWRLLLHGQGLRIPFWYTVQSWFVGRYIGIFLPGTIGLDGYRLYDSSRYTGEIIKCTTVIAIEKLTGFVALTSLVFFTFPLGSRMVDIHLPAMVVFRLALGIAAIMFLCLLLNPRVVQILVTVIPAPPAVRSKFNKLGAAVSAYSGNRADLLLAVVLGILVHVGTCFMYFGTMMAIRAENTSLFDILFASPLMIYATVIGPSVGGEGIREIVFVSLLSARSGAAAALTFAHLGWWVGEFVPFVIGGAVYVLRTRPSKEEVAATLTEVRRKAALAGGGDGLHLTPDQVLDYRERLIGCLVSGVSAGLVAGAAIGLAEAAWLMRQSGGLDEAAVFWWGSLVYGMLFAGAGVAVAAALAFLYLLLNRFPRDATTFAISLGGLLAAGAFVIGRFRFQRDILDGHPLSLIQNVSVLAVAVGIGLLATAVFGALFSVIRARRRTGIITALTAYGLLVAAGIALSVAKRPVTEAAPAFVPAKTAAGPNIIFVAIDALRADYLSLYSPGAVARTPNLDAFRRDAVLFSCCFAQSTWTKPSFATLFTGLYPETHTATSKDSKLPTGIVTVAEVLRDGGYYTKGFSNNANIMSVWDFNQGFVDYTDLKPSAYYFCASPSAAKLSLYNALRLVWKRVVSRKLSVTEFYQPAEVVTRDALDWLDSRAVPAGTPFYLFLHYMDPHDPFMDADKPGVGYARVQMENPPPEMREPMRKAYNDEIQHLDKYLGQLFDGLRQRGLYDDVLILFTADHGEEFYDHDGWWHGQTLYDELMHVPLIIKLPGDVRAGDTNDHLARHVDVAPTFLHSAGLEKPAAMPGASLFGQDNVDANGAANFVYAEVDFENNVLQAVRTHDAKLMHANPDNPRRTPPVAFYDLTNDPREKSSLSGGQNPRKTDEDALAGVLDGMKAFTRENAAEPVLQTGVATDVKDQLEALGYLK